LGFYIEDAKNLARALQDEEYARKLKANLEPAQMAPVREDLLKKPFRWDGKTYRLQQAELTSITPPLLR